MVVDVRDGWEVKKFENCLEKVVYTRKIKRKKFLDVGVFPIVSQEKDEINGFWDNSEDVFSVNKPIVVFGDHTKVIKYIEFDFVLGADGVKILKPINEIETRFLYYYLQNIKLGDLGYARHYRLLKELDIHYPKSLKTQQRIVAILDKAKANAEQNFNNAKELFESYLQNIFENKGEGWAEKRLDEICEITSKLIDPKEKQYQELTHIGAGNIESEKGSLLDLKTAKEEKLISGKFLFDNTMVLYSKIRPYLKKIVNCDFKGLCNADIYPLVPFKNTVSQDFLYYLLSSNNFTKYAIKGSQRAGMPKVNRKHLFNYIFSCPPIEEQHTIVNKLFTLTTETRKLGIIYKQKINDLEELKKSILEKAFNGEL